MVRSSNNIELIKPEDRKGFYTMKEIREIYQETKPITIINSDGEIKTFPCEDNDLIKWLKADLTIEEMEEAKKLEALMDETFGSFRL